MANRFHYVICSISLAAPKSIAHGMTIYYSVAEDGTCGFQGTLLFFGVLLQGAAVLRNPHIDQSTEINYEPICKNTLGRGFKKIICIPSSLKRC